MFKKYKSIEIHGIAKFYPVSKSDTILIAQNLLT